MLEPFFLKPSLLLGIIPVISIIVAIYAKFGRLKTKVVPSLFFIKQLKSTPQRGRKIYLPKRFFWDAVIALFLVSLLAIPQDRGHNTQTAILLDNSASMLAKQENGETTFQKALNYISASKPDYVFVTSPKLTDVTDFKNDLQPILSHKTIEESFNTLVLHRNISRLIILSDQNIYTTSSQNLFLEAPRLSKPQNNIAIQQAVLTDKGYQVQVKSYSETVERIYITTTSNRSEEQSAVVESGKTASIGPFLPSDDEAIDFILKPNDALLEDNKIAGTSAREKPTIIFVAANSFNRNVLSNITSYTINFVAPEQYNADQISDTTVFYRSVPTEFPNNSFIIIAPPTKSTLLGKLPRLPVQTISYIDNYHPIFRYITAEQLGTQDFYSLNSLFGAPILKFGEHAGIVIPPHEYKGVVVGFDLFALSDSLASNILFLNALKWLTESTTKLQSDFPENESELRQHTTIKLDAKKIRRLDQNSFSSLSYFKMLCLILASILLADLAWLSITTRSKKALH